MGSQVAEGAVASHFGQIGRHGNCAFPQRSSNGGKSGLGFSRILCIIRLVDILQCIKGGLIWKTLQRLTDG